MVPSYKAGTKCKPVSIITESYMADYMAKSIGKFNKAELAHFLYELPCAMPVLNRSYDDLDTAYFLVFNPLKSEYDNNKEWYNSNKFISGVRQYLARKYKPEYLILTREINATYPHVNVYMLTSSPHKPIEKGAVNNKFGIYPKSISVDHQTRADVLFYMFKEVLARPLYKFIDWHYQDFVSVPRDTKCEARLTHSLCKPDEDEPIDMTDYFQRQKVLSPM